MNYEEFTDKKISVKIHDRDINGNIDKKTSTFVIGICTFGGYNKFLEKNQVTINRVPIFEEDIIEIKILDN